jgi:hypothetical protein
MGEEKMPEKSLVDRNIKLNPQVAETEVGIRNLRIIKIYPLSMADQLSLTDVITKGLQEFVEQGNQEDIAFVAAVIQLIKDNLANILTMVSDEKGEEIMKELTNPQALQIADLIFDMNFGSLGKNAQSLAEKVRNLFPSARQSPPLSSVVEDTVLKTSTESPTETEEPQLDS